MTKPADAPGQGEPIWGAAKSASAPLTQYLQIVIAAAVVVALLRFAEPFIVPLLVGILTSYTLGPLVTWLQRIHVPRAVGAALVLGAALALILSGLYSLSDDAARLAGQLPTSAKKLRQMVQQHVGGKPNPLASMQKAATELERAASEASGTSEKSLAVPHESSMSRLEGYLLASTSGALARAAELLLALLIAYFLLAAGDVFRRKLARVAGPSLARRRLTIEVLDEINSQVQRYMLVMLFSNILVGAATWALFSAIGLDGAGLWGLLAGVLHLIPYAGSGLLAAAAGAAGLVQFGTLAYALLVAGGTLAIAGVIGIGLTTWLNGYFTRMNPVIVFAGLLFFGWLWGAWGLILSVPLLTVIKAIAERVEGMHALAELMRD